MGAVGQYAGSAHLNIRASVPVICVGMVSRLSGELCSLTHRDMGVWVD